MLKRFGMPQGASSQGFGLRKKLTTEIEPLVEPGAPMADKALAAR
jgi:hypothetical protein